MENAIMKLPTHKLSQGLTDITPLLFIIVVTILRSVKHAHYTNMLCYVCVFRLQRWYRQIEFLTATQNEAFRARRAGALPVNEPIQRCKVSVVGERRRYTEVTWPVT